VAEPPALGMEEASPSGLPMRSCGAGQPRSATSVPVTRTEENKVRVIDETSPVGPKGAVQPLAVSPRKAAAYLDVGHDAIYQLIGQGRLRSVKLGRRRLIPLAELERFLADELA
jgi:excisionase family DNA binding protein